MTTVTPEKEIFLNLVSLIVLAKEIRISVDINEKQKSKMSTAVFSQSKNVVGSICLVCGATLKLVRSVSETTGQNIWRD